MMQTTQRLGKHPMASIGEWAEKAAARVASLHVFIDRAEERRITTEAILATYGA